MSFNGEIGDSIVSGALDCHNKRRTKVYRTVNFLLDLYHYLFIYLYRFNTNCSRLVVLTTVL